MLNAYVSLFLFLLPGICQTGQRSKVFIPTSSALEIATKVAHDEGYPVSHNKYYYFDIALSQDSKPFLPGFVTVGLYGNNNPLNLISINEETGEVIDGGKCIVFDYPDLKPFRREIRKASGATPLPIAELMRSIGCDSFTTQGKPKMMSRMKGTSEHK